MPQQSEIKTLADNRCSLKRLPVTLRQPVHAREDETLDGCRDGFLASFFRVVQELFQKERIAARALDAGKRDRMSSLDETSGKAQRLVPSQWTEIDGREWCSTATCAPRSVKRVALDTRGHNQKAGTVGYGRRNRRKMPKHLWISPMEVLHNDQRRSGQAAARDECRCQFAFAAITSGVVHSVIKRTPLACLRQVKQVMKKNKPIGRDRPFSDQTLGRTVSRFSFRGWRQAEQTQEQSADRVLSFANPEVEYKAAMSNEARGLGETAHLLDQSRFADTRLAAHIDDLTGPPTGHALRILLNCSSSASRPTKALRVAAKGSPERPRSRQARVGASKPFSWISPSASQTPRPERAR